jgi:hypothetical protein
VTDRDPLSQVDRLIADCKKRVATPRSLYRCCEPLRRAFEPSRGTANSSLIGRKSKGDDDHEPVGY